MIIRDGREEMVWLKRRFFSMQTQERMRNSGEEPIDSACFEITRGFCLSRLFEEVGRVYLASLVRANIHNVLPVAFINIHSRQRMNGFSHRNLLFLHLLLCVLGGQFLYNNDLDLRHCFIAHWVGYPKGQ